MPNDKFLYPDPMLQALKHIPTRPTARAKSKPSTVENSQSVNGTSSSSPQPSVKPAIDDTDQCLSPKHFKTLVKLSGGERAQRYPKAMAHMNECYACRNGFEATVRQNMRGQPGVIG